MGIKERETRVRNCQVKNDELCAPIIASSVKTLVRYRMNVFANLWR